MSEPVDLARLVTQVIAEVQPAADSRGVLVRTVDLASFPGRVDTDADALRRTLHQALDFAVGRLSSGVVQVALAPHADAAHTWQLTVMGAEAPDRAPIVSCAATLHLRALSDRTAGRPQRILIVDDSTLQRSLMRAYVEGSPHEAVDVEGGALAVDRVRADTFDAIFVDLQMPGMDGLTTIRKIREIEHSTSRVPATIVALTALGASDDASDALDAGADECLSKPLSQTAFFGVLESVHSPQPAPEAPPPQPISSPSPVPVQPAAPAPAPLTHATSPQLLALAQYQLGTILSGPAAGQLEHLRALSTSLKDAAHASGLQDVAALSSTLEDVSKTGTLRDAVIAARTLQAWISHVEQHDT